MMGNLSGFCRVCCEGDGARRAAGPVIVGQSGEMRNQGKMFFLSHFSPPRSGCFQ